MTTFADTSVLYGAADENDVHNQRSHEILAAERDLTTTDHVLVETWRLVRDRLGWDAAERLWSGLRAGPLALELVAPRDLDSAWQIGRAFRDQEFSLVDRTSFAVMERLGLTRVASFDDDFAVYRYGVDRDRAFDVLR